MSATGLLFKPAGARATDPESSHAAADRMETSGALSKQREIALRAVIAHPGYTSKEIAAASGLDRYMLARRLPELQELGYLRRDKTKARGVRWWPIDG